MHDRHGRRHGSRLGRLGWSTWAAFLAARRVLAAERPWATRSNWTSSLAQREAARLVGPGDADSVLEPCLGTVMVLGPGGCRGGGGRQTLRVRGNPVSLKGSICPPPAGMTGNALAHASLSGAAEARLRLNEKKGPKGPHKGRSQPHRFVARCLCLSSPPQPYPSDTDRHPHLEPDTAHPLDYIIRPPLMKSQPLPARPSSLISP
jgi:hypothetical protein